MLERTRNDLEDRVRVFQGLVVPEAKDAHATVDEAPLSLLVICGLLGHCMPAAVELDRKAGIGAIEIKDEAGERVLATEFPASQPTVAQARPQPDLRVGGDVTHAAGALLQFRTLMSQTALDQ